MNCKFDDCFMALRDKALLVSKVDLASERANNCFNPNDQ